MSDSDIIQRLDILISLTRLAYADRIDALRVKIRLDAVNSTILDLTDDWIGAGDLKRSVIDTTGKSESTVKSRISDLLTIGILTKESTGPTTRYKTTGLI